jgi:hypothetical protein
MKNAFRWFAAQCSILPPIGCTSSFRKCRHVECGDDHPEFDGGALVVLSNDQCLRMQFVGVSSQSICTGGSLEQLDDSAQLPGHGAPATASSSYRAAGRAGLL